jgi:hypothetical protein
MTNAWCASKKAWERMPLAVGEREPRDLVERRAVDDDQAVVGGDDDSPCLEAVVFPQCARYAKQSEELP